MASKEVAIKIRVDNKEIDIADASIDDFKKSIAQTKAELDALGKKTKDNANVFEKLTGELEELEKTFKQVNKEIEDNADVYDVAGKEVKSYTSQIGELEDAFASLGPRTKENAAQYDELAARTAELRRRQEEVQFATAKVEDSLAQLPGPLGTVGRGFQSLNVVTKNARASMIQLTKQFPILNSAIAATGIGALVIILGLLIAAVVKAFKSFEPLQDAVGNLGELFNILGDVIQPLIDLIGKGLTAVLNGLGKALAWVTGNLDEYNEAIANRAATEEFIKNSEDKIKQLEREAKTADDKRKEDIQLEVDKLKQLKELDERYRDEKLEKDEEYYKDREAIEKEYDLEVKKLSDQRIKEHQEELDKKLEQQKQYIKEREELEILLTTRLQDLDNELIQKRLDLIRDENTEKLKIEQEYQLLLLKQKEDNEIAQLRKDQDLAIENAIKRGEDAVAIGVKYEDIISKVKLNAETQRLLIAEEYLKKAQDLQEENIDENKERIEQLISQSRQYTSVEQDILREQLENRSRLIELQGKSEIDLIRQRGMILNEEAKLTRNEELIALKQQLEDKQITEEQFYVLSSEANEKFNLTRLENERETNLAIVESRANMANAISGVMGQLGSFLQEIAGENKELAIAGIVIEKAAAVAQIIAQTAIANAKAVAAFPLTAGQPWVTINTASAALSIASLIAAAAKSINEINGNNSSSSGSGTTTREDYGRNYEDGGVIRGKRHAQGGTLIEAEDGEAIMTRGAVQLFSPLLSAMNQLGGGTSFNRDALSTSYDQPIVNKPSQSETIYMKTYVVESELTTKQQKQARLKDLSTI